MAQRWPLASRLARDARMPCAPARGAPVVSTPEAPCPTRASPHARSPCCLAHCAPRRQARDPGAGDGDEGDGEARVDGRLDRGRAHRRKRRARPPPAPCTKPNRDRAVPCRAVPCRAPFPQTHIRSRPRRIEPGISRSGAERDNQLTCNGPFKKTPCAKAPLIPMNSYPCVPACADRETT